MLRLGPRSGWHVEHLLTEVSLDEMRLDGIVISLLMHHTSPQNGLLGSILVIWLWGITTPNWTKTYVVSVRFIPRMGVQFQVTLKVRNPLLRINGMVWLVSDCLGWVKRVQLITIDQRRSSIHDCWGAYQWAASTVVCQISRVESKYVIGTRELRPYIWLGLASRVDPLNSKLIQSKPNWVRLTHLRRYLSIHYKNPPCKVVTH